jgi:hypothetical protein
MLSQTDDPTTRLHRWLETLTISMAAPLLGLAVQRGDPYLVATAFPWLALVPLLVGASHGLAPGLVSALLLGAGASAHAVRFDALTPDLASWIAGCMSAGAIAGHFCDAARRRRWLLDERANGLALQLQYAQRARQLLEVSHAQLEQRTAEDRRKPLDAQRSALRPPPPRGGEGLVRAPQLPTFQLAAHGGSLARLGQSLKAPKSRPGPNSA